MSTVASRTGDQGAPCRRGRDITMATVWQEPTRRPSPRASGNKAIDVGTPRESVRDGHQHDAAEDGPYDGKRVSPDLDHQENGQMRQARDPRPEECAEKAEEHREDEPSSRTSGDRTRDRATDASDDEIDDELYEGHASR